MSSPIDNLIHQFSKLPSIGPRSARRVVLQLIRKREELMFPLMQEIREAYDNIKTCEICGNIDVTTICNICTDTKRDESILCVVEDIADLWAIERSHVFKGKYHILGGTLSAIDGRSPQDLNLASLVDRVKNNPIKEVILATNATVEGQTTAHYITELLGELEIEISRPAQGIPIGGEMDYLDDGTLGTALNARKAF